MPRTDPNRSFDVAVRHLFRHLDNIELLRRNPLVRALFGLADDPGTQPGGVTLAKIRSKILDAGRACYAEDLAAGSVARAERQFAIVSALCALQPAARIAADLGISAPQFYRDRRTICDRVTRVLMGRQSTVNASAYAYDPVRFALSRVSTLVEQGLSVTALAECERIAAQCSDAADKAQTLVAAADTALRLGDAARAEQALRLAREFAASAGQDGADASVLEMTAQLIDYRLAMHIGATQSARDILTKLVRESERLGGPLADRHDLQVEIALEQSRLSAYVDDIAGSSAAIDRAEEIARRHANAVAAQRVELAVMSAYYAADAMADPGVRLFRLNEALALAISRGSAMGVLFSSIGLAHQSMAFRDAEQANVYADQALQVAHAMEGMHGLVFTSASLAPVFVQARRWSAVDPLLFELEEHCVPMTDIWMNLKLSQGVMLARSGRNLDALAPLTGAVAGARKLRRRQCETMALREFALASHAAGRPDDAGDFIRAAVKLAESSDDRLELHLTYGAASKILRDPRMSRLASQTG